VYREGEVCISILHPPGEDELSGELAAERWMPTQTIASIMLSVISMLNDPNLSSPANVEASVMWRDRRPEFNDRCRVLVGLAKSRLPPHVKIPHPETNEQERKRAMLKHSRMGEDEFGMESDQEALEPSGEEDSNGAESEIPPEESQSEEVKPPRKSKKDSSDKKASKRKKKGTPETDAVNDLKEQRSHGKTPTSSSSPKAVLEQVEEASPKRSSSSNKSKQREVIEESNETEEGESSSSSSLDSKELENLMQPDTEFKQWKRQWFNMIVSKATSKGWVPTKAVNSTSKCRLGSSSLSVLTYNVLRHTTAEGTSRAQEQFKILRDANAHILVLNDVTPAFQAQLAEQAWAAGLFSVYGHDLTGSPTSTPQSSSSSTDVLVKGTSTMVISKSRIMQAQLLPLPSRTDKSLIRMEFEGTAGHSIVLLAASLDDSPRDVKLRVQQLSLLNKALEGFTNHAHVQIVAGDLGLSAGTKEHRVISSSLTDVWTSLHPGDPGLTYDPSTNKLVKVLNSSAQGSRRDRILFKSDGLPLSPTFAQLLGTSKLTTKYKGASVWPSDHYGLMASFAGLTDGNTTSKKSSRCVIS
jgi:endonuclease/exonuclease/phosphatase family metal-dependent hydrolase